MPHHSCASTEYTKPAVSNAMPVYPVRCLFTPVKSHIGSLWRCSYAHKEMNSSQRCRPCMLFLGRGVVVWRLNQFLLLLVCAALKSIVLFVRTFIERNRFLIHSSLSIWVTLPLFKCLFFGVFLNCGSRCIQVLSALCITQKVSRTFSQGHSRREHNGDR